MAVANPFKFGTVVDTPFFTNREKELQQVAQVINSNNHLIMISPRRFGKTSLIKKVIKSTKRKVLFLDVQLANSTEDLVAQYLKRIYRIFPIEKIRQNIKNFRILPIVSLHPVTGEVEISFQPGNDSLPILEDVLNLMEKLSSDKSRSIVVLDEFQDILRLEKGLDRKLRAIIQNHKNINYVFLGSQESMMRDIFEKKESPFYHFGVLFYLQKIGIEHFKSYLIKGLKRITKSYENIADSILRFTGGHPYYTQQLAFVIYNRLQNSSLVEGIVQIAIEETIQVHDFDYERLWVNFNNTDKKLITGLLNSIDSPLSSGFAMKYNIKATSTVFSSLKRLLQSGYVIKTERGYEIDDPFFKQWIIDRRRR
jgi:hypothetical protein